MNKNRKLKTECNKYSRLIRVLQILSAVFMLTMLILCLIFIKKYEISVSNVSVLTQYLTGGTVTVALMILLFTFVKSFALVFPPSVIYVISGFVFDNFWLAVFVNFIGSLISLILPYYLGRFTGAEMITALTQRFKAIKKLDEFTGDNSSMVIFVFKVGGFIPADLSSIVFGAMKIPFLTFYLSTNVANLILNLVWTMVGAFGDFSNPLSVFYVVPPLTISVLAALLMAYRVRKNKQKNK